MPASACTTCAGNAPTGVRKAAPCKLGMDMKSPGAACRNSTTRSPLPLPPLPPSPSSSEPEPRPPTFLQNTAEAAVTAPAPAPAPANAAISPACGTEEGTGSAACLAPPFCVSVPVVGLRNESRGVNPLGR
ncbi:hypothetical protein Vafri_12465 [Volvox africanus]|uniref:Uncharacterized protein n=1 Tax=Volvox africanus TaxID=51714 RepID=A0A8J4BA70_9CHLO|nr:hypothetical protein Vafri_12465 [Volvox africanus]